MPGKTNVDWQGVELDYRAGVMSNIAIAEKYGTGEANIRQMAARRGWRKEGEVVEASVKKALAAQEKPKPNPPKPVVKDPQPEPRKVEPEVKAAQTPLLQDMTAKVEELTEIAIDVINSHRRDIRRLRHVVMLHREELISAFENLPVLEERIMDYYSAKAAMNPLAAQVYKMQMQQALAALSLGSRSKTLLNLVSAFEKVVNLERQSFNLDKEATDKTYDEAVREIHQRAQEKKKAMALLN